MVTPEKMVEIQKLYERGVPVKILTQNYSVSRQTISKYAKRLAWNHPRYKRVNQFEKIEKSTKRLLKERADKELRLLKLHQQEFQIVRQLLQAAIDYENLKTASLAKQISETLLIVHNAELRHLSLIKGNTGLKRQIPLHSTSRAANLAVSKINGSKTPRLSMAQIKSSTIMDLFENWKQNKDNLSPSTSSHWRKAINSFIEFIGHSNAQAVSRDDAIRWRDWLLTQNYARKTIESSYIGAPRAIFNNALSSGYIEHNPFRAIQLPKSKVVRKRSKAYSDDEARLILKSSLKLKQGREKDHVFNLRKWAPWIAAFTGARINEICQLRKEDFQQKSGILSSPLIMYQ